MAIQVINTGTSANSGNGDTLRSAFGKVNQNFQELSTLLGSTGTTFLELVEDATADLMIHSGHSGFTVTYDDENDQLLFSVEPGPSGPKGDQGPQGIAGVDGSSIQAALTPPSTPAAGDLWYDTSSGRLYVYFDSSWIDASPANHTPYDEVVYDLGLTTGTITINRDLGSVQMLTAASDVEILGIDGMPSGRSFTLIVIQDDVGNRNITFPSEWKFSSGARYLNVAPNSIDMINIAVIGTYTFAVVSLGYE